MIPSGPSMRFLCRGCHSRGPETGLLCNYCRWEYSFPEDDSDKKNETKLGVSYDRPWFGSLLKTLVTTDEYRRGPCVYFIRSGEDGPIKIGFSVFPERRIQQLQATSPTKLSFARIVVGDRSLELDLHRYFKDYRLHGEWFEPCDDLLEIICPRGSVQCAPGGTSEQDGGEL